MFSWNLQNIKLAEHCLKSVRIRSYSGPYSVRMREIQTRATANTDTFHAVEIYVKCKTHMF